MKKGGDIRDADMSLEINRASKIEDFVGTLIVELLISDDGLKCWLRPDKPKDETYPDESMLTQALRNARIQDEFIDNEAIAGMVEKKIFGKAVLVAAGIPPENGEDGRVIYFFNTEPVINLKEDDQGKVDFKEINLIQQVKTGEKLAELIPPTDGSPGKTVTGEPIEQIKGKPAVLPARINADISTRNPNRLIAAVDGAVELSGKKVIVDPVVYIDGDVDYSTGNIDFDGAVVVKGEVKSGFSIKAKGEVTVEGVVEDAVIDTRGSVIIKGGFLGRGTGSISAKENVMVKFAESQTIYAGKDIYVDEALLHATVEADGKITVSGKRGIIGGKTSAFEQIETPSAGSQSFTKTVLVVGLKREMRLKIERLEKEIATNTENIEKIQKALLILKKVRLLKDKLTKKQQHLYQRLHAAREKLEIEQKELIKKKDKLDSDLKYIEKAVIKIEKKTYPGVHIHFGKYKKAVEFEDDRLIFRWRDNKIVAFKMT